MDGNNYWHSRGGLRLNRRRLIAAGAGTSGTTLLAACGQKSGGSAKSGATSAGQTAKPVSGGTVRVPLTDDFYTFDPSIDAKIVNPNAQTLAYESLLQFKAGPNVDYYDTTLQPRLAQSWEIPDAQTYIFHMRKGVKFANLPPVNGRPLTSADVKFNLEYEARSGAFKDAKIPPGDLNYMFEGMDSVTTPDDSIATVHFAQPFAPFLNYATSVGTLIMPPELMNTQGGFNNNIAGTGAFQLDMASSQHGTHYLFKKNPTYWDSGKPYLDGVNHVILRDTVTTQGAFQARQIDIYSSMDPQVIAVVKKTNPDAVTLDYVSGQQGLYINNSHAPLTDERVRKAIWMTIDRKAFDNAFSSGKGGFAIAGTIPGIFSQDEMAQLFKPDPAGAKALLSAAGFPNGMQLEVMQTGNDTRASELLQSQLKPVGITLTIAVLDAATWATRLHQSKFDLSNNGFAVVNDVDSKLYGNFDSKSSGDYVGAKDPAYDKLAEAQRQVVDPAKRKEAVRAAALYLEQHAMSTTLYQSITTAFWQPAVNGYAPKWQSTDWLAPQVWLSRS
jgi:peptide/nickel transport system substrate-binding protein